MHAAHHSHAHAAHHPALQRDLLARSGRDVGLGERIARQLRRSFRGTISGWICRIVGEVEQLVGEIAVEIVRHRITAPRGARHIDNEIGPHRRPKQQPAAFQRMRIAGLAVIGDDNRIVSLEAKRDDAGECCIRDAEPYPFPRLYRNLVGNPAIHRDGIADASRHPRFHAIAETSCDLSIIVEAPIRDEPGQIAVGNRDRVAFLDDQRARQPAPELLQTIGVRVIPEGAGIGRREFVNEAFAGADRFLRQAGHSVHRIRQADAVPMDCRVLAELVGDDDPRRLALPNTDFRTGHGGVIGPHSGIRMAAAGQVDRRRLGGEPIFLDLRSREAAAKRGY